MYSFPPACLVAPVLAVIPAQPQDQPPDKSAFGLSNPTPRALMRPLNTDRPDATESPRTVDAGHVQLELSFVEWGRERDTERTDSWDILPLALRVGIAANTEVQLLVNPWSAVDVRGGGRAEGLGGLGVRLKHNLWGNDADGTALALMPFLTFPAGADGVVSERIEGGVAVPFEVGLPGEFSLGLMAQFELVWDDADGEYDLEILHTAALGRDIVGPVAAFVEYEGVASSAGARDYRASINTGVTLGLGPNVQWDAGVGIGLTDAAEDVRVFAGLVVRF